ncbi:DUF2089-like zinc ribbon domain-containing protein [Propionibacteriaceae bacterium Y2011]|uniref:DUF2089-like zinc ribbon domain-containing protein n=1 Tax=Microlunatus sp. Y2014 TaxID=3418488 RepID=UPI003B4A807F
MSGRAGGYRAPSDCPVCGDDLMLTQLACDSCDTELSGRFEACDFCGLDTDEYAVVRALVVAGGDVAAVAGELGTTTQDVARRLAELAPRFAPRAPGSGDAAAGRDAVPDRDDVLTRVVTGELTPEEARNLLS